MATEAQIKANRENAKKGGRKKGLATIRSEQARALLAQMVFDEITPLGQRLIKAAKSGNIMAMKELFDRAFGKAPQPVDLKAAISIGDVLDEEEGKS